MAGQTQDLDVQLQALFSMAVAHMESQGVNVEPAENTSVAGPDRKRRKLFHVYQQTKQLLGALNVDDETDPTLHEDPAGPISQPEPAASGGEPEISDTGEDRSEASSDLDDHHVDPNFEPSESSDETSQLTDAPEMNDSEDISVHEHDNDNNNEYGRSGTPEEIDNALCIPILGQVTGFCQNCNERPAQTVCYTCGTGRFCGYECWRSFLRDDEKHTCPDVDEPYPASGFWHDMVNDSLPFNRRYFGFWKCRSLGEESTLLGLYRHLWLSHYLNMFQLNQWWESKQMYNNIVKTFTRRPHIANYTYVSWFKRRGNALFSEEDRSEVLNLDLFE